jgi:pimeloyl-ACP methyl ester carboxylesterase
MGASAVVEIGVVSIGELTIAYRHAGAGPPLVLLHGGWSDSRVWRLQLEALADVHHVVAWDAPGCGESSDPPEGFGLPDYADAAAAFVDAVGLQRPHLLGLSWGGGLALEVYRRHPSLPRSLVLAGAYAGWAGSLPPEVVRERISRALDEAERPPKEWIASYLPSYFAGPVAQERVDELLAVMSDARAVGIRAMLTSFAEADLRDVLPRISCPTLVLHAEGDVRAPFDVAKGLHERIPASELVVLPGVGHVSNIEAPELFSAEVRRFLATVA